MLGVVIGLRGRSMQRKKWAGTLQRRGGVLVCEVSVEETSAKMIGARMRLVSKLWWTTESYGSKSSPSQETL